MEPQHSASDRAPSLLNGDAHRKARAFAHEERGGRRGARGACLASIAGRKGATPAQIALAWLLAKKPWIVPIPGTTKLSRLEENLAAADVQLTKDDLGELEAAAAKITVQGGRYPRHLEERTGR
jgi:aryl-alcohol dehydrogenase-like predicted oxidoreductase